MTRVRDWPNVEFPVNFDGNEFLLLPETEQTPSAIAIETTNLQMGRAAIRRFLSAFAWSRRCPAEDDFGVGAGFPGGIGKNRGPILSSESPTSAWTICRSRRGRRSELCLGLYREALNLDNIAYRFLTFFKIINVLHQRGDEQIRWINAALPKLRNHEVAERLEQLQPTEPDVGKYLYGSGRCAVAHAFGSFVADPDDPADTERFHADSPVIQALAEHLIEHELLIKSADTVRREHLFELEGFRRLFGPALAARLKDRAPVSVSELPVLPSFSIQVRDRAFYRSLLSTVPTVLGINDGVIGLLCRDPAGHLQVYFELDFPNERLRFDPMIETGVSDDGSPAAGQARIDAYRLRRDVFLNGVVELWTEGEQRPWGQAEVYLPLNMRYDHQAAQRELGELFRQYLLRLV